jgi:xanthine dehydrogenase accessory factor
MSLRQGGATRVLIRGVGDIGSAVARRLFVAGYAVVVHDGEQPTTTRRGMAFADAMFDGQATLDGIAALHVDHPEAVPAVLADRAVVPVAVGVFGGVLRAVAPDVLVDARMRKRDRPEGQRGLAPLTIGLGPNFAATPDGDL